MSRSCRNFRVRAAVAAFAVIGAFSTGCGSATTSEKRVAKTTRTAPATQPLVEVEPNDASDRAQGPLGGSLTLTRANVDDDKDEFYVRVAPGRSLTLVVTHVAGKCGNSFVSTAYPGPPGSDNGGQAETAIAADAPETDENGNRDEGIGDAPGTRLTAELAPSREDSATGLVLGLVRYGDGLAQRDGVGDESTVGCTVRIDVQPASAIDPRARPQDAEILKDPDLAEQG